MGSDCQKLQVLIGAERAQAKKQGCRSRAHRGSACTCRLFEKVVIAEEDSLTEIGPAIFSEEDGLPEIRKWISAEADGLPEIQN